MTIVLKFRGELDPFELETIFESGLTDRNEEQQEWPVHLLVSLSD